jgi:hypothetical protein
LEVILPTLLEYAKKELQKGMIKFDPIKDNPDPIGWSKREAELCYRNNIVTRLNLEAYEVIEKMAEESRNIFYGYMEEDEDFIEDEEGI